MDSQYRQVTIIENGQARSESLGLIGEEPLSIRIQGLPYAVIMRTPGHEKEHVAGFCLSEGIVNTTADMVNIAFCNGDETNVITVTLTPERRSRIARHLDRRTYISQTSCGICGKSIVADLKQALSPMTDVEPLDSDSSLDCLIRLSYHQPLRGKTRAAHGAVIYDHELNRLSSAEDVGRHNALDKAIGKLFLNKELNKARLLTLSSRMSYEMVQKAARAKIPVVLALSRPTALATELAESLNMTLASLENKNDLYIYCNPQHLTK